jgi:hypothetical protein
VRGAGFGPRTAASAAWCLSPSGLKVIVSGDLGALFLFHWKDMKFVCFESRHLLKEQFGTTDPGIVSVRRIFLPFRSCRPESASMNWRFPAEFHSSGGFHVHELVIPGVKPFLRWLPTIVRELVIHGGIHSTFS